MKKLLHVFVLIAATTLAGIQANAQQDQGQAEEVKKVERQWLDAYEKHDSAAMDKIVANDFTGTLPDGSVQTKSVMRLVKNPRPPDMPAPKFYSQEVKAHVYGDTVVLTGKIITEWPGGNKQQARYTDTYVKRNGSWQVVASHTSGEGPRQRQSQ